MLRFAVLIVCVLCAAPVFSGVLVVASVEPLAMVSMAVAKPDTEVKALLRAGADVHDYQLTPSNLAQISAADIVVWAGAAAEPYLAPVLRVPRAGQVVIDVSALPGAVLRDQRLDPADTKKRGMDPHLWLSTHNASLLAVALAAHLNNVPAADHFVAETERYRHRQEKRFAPVTSMPLLVAHDAYGYLFAELGLRNASAVLINPEMPASARRMAELAARVRSERITCMIGEPGFEQGAAARLFEGIKTNLVVIDPMLASMASGPDGYVLAMTLLADTLYGCLVTRP